MKKVILAFIFGALVFFCGIQPMTAGAEELTSEKIGIYVEPKISGQATLGGYLDGKLESDMSFGGGLAAGYDFWYFAGVPVRTEVEYMIRTNSRFETDDANVRAEVPQTVFANAYWDFRNSTRFTPYVGGGIGAAFVGSESNFAWNVGTGIGYDITDDLKATLGYRYVDFGKVEDRDMKGSFQAHEATLGLRYTF